eukprot:3028050-Pyramimonas_sp.AAC.1
MTRGSLMGALVTLRPWGKRQQGGGTYLVADDTYLVHASLRLHFILIRQQHHKATVTAYAVERSVILNRRQHGAGQQICPKSRACK